MTKCALKDVVKYLAGAGTFPQRDVWSKSAIVPAFLNIHGCVVCVTLLYYFYWFPGHTRTGMSRPPCSGDREAITEFPAQDVQWVFQMVPMEPVFPVVFAFHRRGGEGARESS